MKETSLAALRVTFRKALEELQHSPELPIYAHWKYRREASGQWVGESIGKPIFMALGARDSFRQLASEIEAMLKQDYPEYLRPFGTMQGRAALQPIGLLSGMLEEAHKRYGTFALADEQICSVIADVATFFDRKSVRLRLLAPALNLHGPLELPPIAFAGGLLLRPITDEECTLLYGGNPMFQPMFQARRVPMFPSFVFTNEIEVTKVFDGDPPKRDMTIPRFQQQLETCMLALATFKDAGAVGYDGIWLTPAEFVAGGIFQGYYPYPEHVPFNSYTLMSNEAADLEIHAKHFDGIHPALEMASQRLVDAARRTKPRDTLIDAVIGLETILLNNIDSKGELGFRFSLRYASLFPRGERRHAYSTAKDLYNLRSTIAHGSSRPEAKISGKKMSFTEAATLARSLLRKVITMFLTDSGEPKFAKQDYWMSKELGLVGE